MYLMDYLMNISAFPDLTQGEATINKKNLSVDAKKATLVYLYLFVTNDNDLSVQVLKLV